MTRFQRFRIWIDEVQAGGLGEGKLLYAVGAFPLLAVPLLGRWWIIPALTLAMSWMIFLLWRLWLMAKTGYIASDVPQGRAIDPPPETTDGETSGNGC